MARLMEVKSFSFRFNETLPPGHILDARVIMDPSIKVHKGMVITDGDLRAEISKDSVAGELIRRGIKYLEDNPDATLLVGCDYGRHRSVTVASAIASHFGIRAEHLSPGSNGNRAMVIP